VTKRKAQKVTSKDGFRWQRKRLSFEAKTAFVHGKNGLVLAHLQPLANQ
jgi:hypothetical protein